ncbi:PepSY domain-containing protein [Leekyejoonella antrihumi]|uniref:PepSY domain-containing protein n=1 Tax=Leekyejoonella antrihumi TaxID=1660198 RepID=A0A563E833_9MICO|nr:PepSY domain-containing protein [Leekyejoonella antrihumi]TWP38605.1 hypothetical protein FGL98_02125 [Leekyejoonella antrihumi]
MKTPRLPKRRIVMLTLPVTGAALLGGAGWASATGHVGGDAGDHVAYHSSVTTRATGDSGNEGADDLALSKLAKVDLAQAARAGAHAIPGGTVTGVELANEGGNVVYTVNVATATAQTEVIIDAGNGRVLAQNTEHGNDHADQRSDGQGRTSSPHTPSGAGSPRSNGR